MLESLGWKDYVWDAGCIDKSARVTLIWNVGIEKGSHRDVITWRGIILALENRMTTWLSGVRCEGPPIARTARVFY